MHHFESNNLVEHFFRREYGKLLALTSKYIDLESAEDIVQDTLLAATEHWKIHGVPINPEAWLYKTAKNKTLNQLRKRNTERHHENKVLKVAEVEIEFSDELISDELLRMMLRCCHQSLSTDITLVLILKTLCGFSILEIASAFYTNTETIKKRLVRGRKKLKPTFQNTIDLNHLNENIETVLKALYLLFNEGYLPATKNQSIRKEMCLEAIRLAHIIVDNHHVKHRENAHALLALMYLNCSRFEAREGLEGDMIELEFQDRNLWSKELIDRGLHHLSLAQTNGYISKYLILAGIAGNHCVARTFEETNWKEILSLYDALLTIDNSPIVQLNRIVALSMAEKKLEAMEELQRLKDFYDNYLFYSVLAKLSAELGRFTDAVAAYMKAIDLASNQRIKNFLSKKVNELVPISTPHV